jgi:hypothetical protein
MVSSRASFLAILAISTVALGACDLLLKIGRDDRYLAPNLDCSGGTCVCTGGFDDCDGDPDNGCESDVTGDAANCGACGNYCDNGTCVAGSCACTTGYGDCDGDPSNGCETALDVDGENCGSCGASCAGGQCEGGTCKEMTFTDLSEPASIAAYDGKLYFAGCGDPPVGRSDGVTTEALGFGASGCGALISVTPQHVFWVLDQDPTIHWADPAIPYGESDFATGVKAWRVLLASSSHVYYLTNESPTSIRRLRVDQPGAAAEVIASSVVPLAMAVDEQGGYWSDGDGLHMIPHDGTTPALIDGNVFPTSLAVAGGTLFGADTSGVLAIPLDGSPATQIVTSSSVAGLAADASHVYWADAIEGTIHRAAQDGSDDVTLATGQAFSSPPQLSLDATSIYWIGGGRVHRAAR